MTTAFSSEQFLQKLQQLAQESFTGAVEVSLANSGSQAKSSIIIFREGNLVFASPQPMNPVELATYIGKKLKIGIIDTAIETAKTKVSNPNSYQELFKFLAKMRIVRLEQIEKIVGENILLTVESLQRASGTIATTDLEFDLSYQEHTDGWSLQEIEQQLEPRHEKWQKLQKAEINSVSDVPKISPQGLGAISSVRVKKHCQDWIDGTNSIETIARQVDRDPLKLAIDYYNWVKQGWIYFGEVPLKAKNPPAQAPAGKVEDNSEDAKSITVLSVDDSPIVQSMLKRSLEDSYNVVLAGNGMEALRILNSKQKIDLVFLDVTMPDVDGIELCRTIRRFKKFKDLPIIMLTAKDGMFDKVKGKFAGSTEYLTKPVDKDTLMATVSKYAATTVPVS